VVGPSGEEGGRVGRVVRVGPVGRVGGVVRVGPVGDLVVVWRPYVIKTDLFIFNRF